MKGPNLFRGYWGKPEATAEVLVDGWLRSGDIGRIDDEGFLYVEDRAKDMVLRAGENVYSAEVEAAIYEHPAVNEAAVFGVPDERLGEEVACVVNLDPARPHRRRAPAVLTGHLSPFKIPTRIAIIHDRLPRSPSGKFLKRELRTHTSTLRGNPEPSVEVSPTPLRSAPFDAGSVSIRLYPHNELPADAIVRELCAQAGLALEAASTAS